MSMYIPRSNVIADEQEIRSMVAEIGTAQLITVGRDGYPQATLLPVIWEGDTVVAHMARANGHWKQIEADAPALLVVTGAQAYVSPSWYPSKAEHGKVVPTWNYSAVQLAGRAWVHDDPVWLRRAVDVLVQRHEAGRPAPWASSDAPEPFIDGQLRAIVGIEVLVERVDAKAKLSQNRSEADREGVIAGLRQEPLAGAREVAEQMRRSA